MAVKSAHRLAIGGLFKRDAKMPVRPDPVAQPIVPSMPNAESIGPAPTINGFVGAVRDLPDVRRITARSIGPRVEFIVTTDGSWDEAIKAIEPRIRGMLLSGALFDYTVVETRWAQPDRPGHHEILGGSPAIARAR